MSERICTTPQSTTLTLLLALDGTGEAVLRDVQRSCLQERPQQALLTALLPPQPDDLPGLPRLRLALETALHDLCSHERFIQAGLSNQAAVNLDLVVVGDLVDEHTASMILPLAALLQDILTYEPYGMAHFLLSAAIFLPARPIEAGAPATGDQDGRALAARLHHTLQAFDAFLSQEEGEARQRLAAACGLGTIGLPNFQVYLFDHRKEGSLEVKDQAELQIIMSNFLRALLTDGFAQRLGSGAAVEKQERRAFYTSAAATALVYEPTRLIESCAARLAVAFIDSALDVSDGPASKPPPWHDEPRLVEDLAHSALQELADLDAWAERLRQDTPFQALRTERGPYLDLQMAGLSFENAPPSEWVERIRQRKGQFESDDLPAGLARLEANLQALAAELVERLGRSLQAMPQEALLQGGSLCAARQAIHQIEVEIQRRAQTSFAGRAATNAAPVVPSLPLSEPVELALLAVLLAEPAPRPTLKSFLALLRSDLADPGLIARSGSLLNWISRLVSRWLRQGEQRLIDARQRALNSLEEGYSQIFAERLSAALRALGEQLRAPVVQSYEDLDRLKAAAKGAREKLAMLPGVADRRSGVKALAGQAIDQNPAEGSTLQISAFRQEVSDEQVDDWFFCRWRPGDDEIRNALIEGFGLLADWRQIDAEALAERLQAYGRILFAPPARNLSLSEVLAHSSRRPGQAHGLTEGSEKTLEALLPRLAQGATPLLRPNFDRLGGGAGAPQTLYVLGQGLDAPAARLALHETALPVAVIPISDPYVLVCCRVRPFIPLAALTDLLRQGQKACEAAQPQVGPSQGLAAEVVQATPGPNGKVH